MNKEMISPPIFQTAVEWGCNVFDSCKQLLKYALSNATTFTPASLTS